MSTAAQEAGPVDVLGATALRVVRGDPSAAELAALVAVLTIVLRDPRDRADAAPAPCGRAHWDRESDPWRGPLAWSA
ncbi:acyl-CoA carboxylase subunit epsilon [Streptomyces sp. A1277]|uniref:acyl-CoA carboxylase epsilon subunit n=1 Tax=Streptomyces sp. A1277 TaxID=2563103 RepID=UPI0010A257D8|nr:acyl-CoA carboxylase epsilon subunit [Streptomyces sp. A1277]THA36612.1 acyl-CoA carboxylase subunit epsilon [Streptomyces sp. A1277]